MRAHPLSTPLRPALLLASLSLIAGCSSGSDGSATSGSGADATQVLAFELPSQEVLEGAGLVQVKVISSIESPGRLAIPVVLGGSAEEGLDYTADTAALELLPGQTEAYLDITLLDDDLMEGYEAITIEFAAPSPTTQPVVTRHTLTIHDHALGEAIDGLTVAEQEAFERGRLQFERRFQPSEGLGPFYNATSCVACHSTPVTGGSAPLYRNFFLATFYIGDVANQGASIAPGLSKVVPSYGTGAAHSIAQFSLQGGRPTIPETYGGWPTVSAQRNSIPVLGTGLFETVSDATIASNADPDDLDGDGISGRANTTIDGSAVGRFGLKAQVNNVELFTRGPLQNQMGITSNPVQGVFGIVSLGAAQEGSNPNFASTDGDGTPDPEIAPGDLADLIAFTRFLGPPLPRTFDESATRGEVIFHDLRCDRCHVPELEGSRGPVRAYSDLLLHDMGPDLADNFVFGDVGDTTQEFRTQPLWGISEVGPYLHDGRAATIEEAILMHGGEALLSRDFYAARSDEERADLLRFLESL